MTAASFNEALNEQIAVIPGGLAHPFAGSIAEK
jgi:hypothetical protein